MARLGLPPLGPVTYLHPVLWHYPRARATEQITAWALARDSSFRTVYAIRQGVTHLSHWRWNGTRVQSFSHWLYPGIKSLVEAQTQGQVQVQVQAPAAEPAPVVAEIVALATATCRFAQRYRLYWPHWLSKHFWISTDPICRDGVVSARAPPPLHHNIIQPTLCYASVLRGGGLWAKLAEQVQKAGVSTANSRSISPAARISRNTPGRCKGAPALFVRHGSKRVRRLRGQGHQANRASANQAQKRAKDQAREEAQAQAEAQAQVVDSAELEVFLDPLHRWEKDPASVLGQGKAANAKALQHLPEWLREAGQEVLQSKTMNRGSTGGLAMADDGLGIDDLQQLLLHMQLNELAPHDVTLGH